MQEIELELRDRIKDLVRAKKYDELEEAWLQVLEDDRSVMFHESLVRYLSNRKELERIVDLYTTLLTQSNESGRHQYALDVADVLLEFNPSASFLRSHLIEGVRGLHADRDPDRMAEFLRISGLDGETPDLSKAMAKLDDLLGASKGQVFRHNQWGLGIVKELDAREGWAILDFPKKPNHRMTIEGIKNFLQRIPHDHILAKIAKDPEKFKAEIFEDYCAAMRLALKSVGGKIKAGDLKKLMTTGFLAEDEYKKWWNKAKNEIRLDPFIDQRGKGTSMELILRKEPRSFVDEIRVRLLEAKNITELRSVLRDVDRHGDAAEMSADDHEALTALYLKRFEDGRLSSPEEMFAYGLLFEEYKELFSEGAENPIHLEEFLNQDKDQLVRLLASLDIFELKRIALERVFEMREEDTPVIFSEVFFDADARLVSWMERKLASKGSHDVMEHCLERILSQPERNPELFIWTAKKVMEGVLPHVTESVSPLAILQLGITAMNDFEEENRRLDGKDKDVASKANKLRLYLQEGQFKNIKKAVRGADAEEARRFLGAVNMLGAVSNQMRLAIEQIVYHEHPNLKKSTRQDEEEEKSTAFHYSTADAVERKRLQMSHILNVEIPENSIAIGTARELGDLRENAEYHAAKDRQKLLMQQAAELESLISRARIVELDKVKTDRVRFGTTVALKNQETGEEEECTLLGIWEADADKKIISYLTPFGSQIMNRKLNEQFTMTLPDGRTVNYEVTRIQQAVLPAQ